MVSCHIEVFKPFWVYFLCIVSGNVLISLIYMWPSSFPSTTCWRHCLSSIVYSWLFCQTLIDHRCVSLFLGSLFSSIDLYVCFCASASCFDYCSFVVLSEVWKDYASSLVFLFLRIALAILDLWGFYINFRIICSSSVKNVMCNMIGITLSL